jgi:hypothetical protein
VVAVPGDSSAAVSWVAPVANAGSVVTSYSVTSSPTGGNCADCADECRHISGVLVFSEINLGTSLFRRGIASAGLRYSVPTPRRFTMVYVPRWRLCIDGSGCIRPYIGPNVRVSGWCSECHWNNLAGKQHLTTHACLCFRRWLPNSD